MWHSGQYLSLDESMILYRGRAVVWIQYMPLKPIKHGIKVFCLVCAVSGVMLSFIVYTGKDNNKTDNTVVGLVDQLIENAGIATNPGTLNPVHGRTIVYDNYYTSMKLTKHLYDKYKWTIIGTMVPTEKKSPADQDVPFAKLSKGAMRKLNRGWCREACIEMKSPDGAKYYIQHTTWKDKKQVTWLNTHRVKKSEATLSSATSKARRSGSNSRHLKCTRITAST